MRIFHVALRSEWDAARPTGVYERSTPGRPLAEVGFVHCARADQWQAVRDSLLAEVSEPLVLLVIDTDLLDAPVVTEPGEDGSGEHFPHVYGVVPTAAVVSTSALSGPGAAGSDLAAGRSFASLLMADIGVRIALAVTVMVASGVAGTLAGAALGQPATLLAALVTLAVGTVLAVAAYRRWETSRD